MSTLRATARLQLHKEFTFDHAAAQVDYFAALGISHFYVSPILSAQPGSRHGYNIVDPSCINPELGGEPGLQRLVERLHARGMGLIVDIVPNHLGVGRHNPWWQDVLRWGASSRYARWFDIDWHSPDTILRGKVLLPFLGRSDEDVLQSGEIRLVFDAGLGQFFFDYGEQRFPLAPDNYADVLEQAGSSILSPALLASLDIVEGIGIEERQVLADSAFALLRELSANPAGLAAIETALSAFSPALLDGASALRDLLARQHYCLSHWINAGDEINWRRFFEVSELAGVRIEEEGAFEAMHAVLFRLVAAGWIDGVRIDHIDGLADPAAYCLKLRAELVARMPQPAGAKESHTELRAPYLIAEKILGPEEELRPGWQLDGTTGYEFMDQVSALLHDAAGEAELNAIWQETGGGMSCSTGVEDVRRRFLSSNFASEFNALVRALHAVALADGATADTSLMAIHRTLTELLVAFPLYRTYADVHGRDAVDQCVMDAAVKRAAARILPVDQPVLALLEQWLGGRHRAISRTSIAPICAGGR
ncbi:malto-oligosyltrehalose synthase [Herbaspirillum sp. RTI4]|uniref:malto-oligosyltrehalose synthase n=1 Tax=Herbaspirillum sp. RTI4 TaxID=3048640 RepID=UPI002AB38B95|nr:malto-oligosyltrehalose synthase [Herbaspirillum sp. RTI4]MDY7579061.1 malto-oligosyltrehalose synthase [Herbaspirillum sp. RTI4]